MIGSQRWLVKNLKPNCLIESVESEACARELLETVGPEGTGTLYDSVLAAIERPLIELVLDRAGGNQVRAADILGINRNTLRKKIADLGIAVRKASGGSS